MARVAASAIKVLFIRVPPKINVMSGSDCLANKAEANVADAERWTEVVIALGHAKPIFRIGPGSPADDRQRNTGAALITGLASFAVISLRAWRIVYRGRGVVIRSEGV